MCQVLEHLRKLRGGWNDVVVITHVGDGSIRRGIEEEGAWQVHLRSFQKSEEWRQYLKQSWFRSGPPDEYDNHPEQRAHDSFGKTYFSKLEGHRRRVGIVNGEP